MSDPQVFVSYAHEDVGLRDALVDELSRWGIKVWSDKELRTGESFNENIAHALYKARAMVLLSSGDSMTSEYVTAEVTFARKLGKRICEVSVQGNRHPDLTDIQRVDFRFGGEWADVVADLAPSLKRSIGPSEIFIAHDLGGDPSERDFVDWVTRELDEQGLDVWYEEDRIEFGDDREGMVSDAIDRAGVILAILSERSVGSERFCQHIMRGLIQSDDVLSIIHRSESTNADELRAKWREKMAGVAAGNRFESTVMERFGRVVRLEPAVFVGASRDAQLMAQVAKGLRKRQEVFLPDAKLEDEVARVFKEFMATMNETGMNAAEVLSLPQFKARAVDASGSVAAGEAVAVGETPRRLEVVDTPEVTIDLTDQPPEQASTPKFCRKCGFRTMPGDAVCRNCGQDF